MPPSAHTALIISIVASALGALAMCLLVARFGFTTPSGEETERGRLVTRFGHALAGVCFAATGILSLVALAAPTREARPAPAATVVRIEPDRAADARLQALATEVKAIGTRLEQAEARMTTVDGAARRLGDEVGSISARAKQLERIIAAIPRRVAEPPVKDTKPAPAAPREPVKEPSRAPERPTAPPAVTEVPAPTPPPASLPLLPEPVAAPRPPAPEPLVTPRPRAPEPPTHRPLPTAARVPEPAASPRVSPPAGRATIEAPAHRSEGGAAVAKPDDPQLVDKLREDWKTIRGGLSTAGDDFKAAFRDLGRKLWR